MKLENKTTTSAGQTQLLGKEIAKEILKSGPKEKAIVLALQGDLGGGKTTFVQGLAEGLGIKEKILSPTFVILKRFQVSGFKFHDFYHIDCYRIKEPKEILDLGFAEIIANPQNIIAIEWAEIIKKILPKDALWLNFEFKSSNKRKIMTR